MIAKPATAVLLSLGAVLFAALWFIYRASPAVLGLRALGTYLLFCYPLWIVLAVIWWAALRWH